MPTQARDAMRVFGVCRTGLHGVSAATERRDAHDAGFLTGEQFERRSVGVARTVGAVEYVDGVCHGEVPERDGRAAGHQRRSSQFHDGSDGSFGDSVELMHVRWAGGVMYSRISEELRKLTGEELTGVIAV
eukprot:6212507-Pleurochrysis_carterae.AAC.3